MCFSYLSRSISRLSWKDSQLSYQLIQFPKLWNRKLEIRPRQSKKWSEILQGLVIGQKLVLFLKNPTSYSRLIAKIWTLKYPPQSKAHIRLFFQLISYILNSSLIITNFVDHHRNSWIFWRISKIIVRKLREQLLIPI